MTTAKMNAGTEQTDAELVQAAQQGDRRALDALVRRHEAVVYRFGRRMCRDEADAEEVLQDTFLAMTRGLGDFRGASSLSTWLYTIARSFCIKKRRRSKFAPAHVASIDEDQNLAASIADAQPRPDDAVALAQVKSVLGGVIADLRPMYREVLVLRDVEGLPAAEVSEVLGISVQAVKSRLHRAREQVRSAVAAQVGWDDLPQPSNSRCGHTAQLFSRYLEGEIDGSTCAIMQQHIDECEHCRTLCQSLRTTLAACQQSAAEADVVPTKVQQSVRDAVRAYLDTH